MSGYLILLPAPEAQWASKPASEHEKGVWSDVSSRRTSRRAAHALTVWPLEPSAQATRCAATATAGCW